MKIWDDPVSILILPRAEFLRDADDQSLLQLRTRLFGIPEGVSPSAGRQFGSDESLRRVGGQTNDTDDVRERRRIRESEQRKVVKKLTVVNILRMLKKHFEKNLDNFNAILN